MISVAFQKQLLVRHDIEGHLNYAIVKIFIASVGQNYDHEIFVLLIHVGVLPGNIIIF